MSWNGPSVGTAAVTSYVITVRPGDLVVQVAAGRNGTTILDLDNGVQYSIAVQAVNEHGASKPSSAVTATPTLGEEPEVERLIVAYEPGVPVVESPGRATGSAAVDDVALLPDKPLGSGMRTVELSEPVSEDTARDLAAELTADPRVKWAQPDYFVPVMADAGSTMVAGVPGKGSNLAQSAGQSKSSMTASGASGQEANAILTACGAGSAELVARCFLDSTSDSYGSTDAEAIYSDAYVRSSAPGTLIVDQVPLAKISDRNWLLYSDTDLQYCFDTDGDGSSNTCIQPRWAALGDNESTGITIADRVSGSWVLRGSTCSGTITRRLGDHAALVGTSNSWWELSVDWSCLLGANTSNVRVFAYLDDYLAPMGDLAPNTYSGTAMSFVAPGSPGGGGSTPAPTAPPGAPTAVALGSGSGAINASWSSPTTGGGAIQQYTARAYSAATGGTVVGSCVSSSATCRISGLANGSTAWVDVTATNAVGTGPASSPRMSGAVTSTFPNDPRYSSGEMWGLNGTYGIRAPEAWAITKGSPSIVVAVLDTGITAHQDLTGQTVSGYDMIVDTAVANDGDGRDSNPSDPGDWVSPYNSSWHGTHVTGTIAAIGNNGEGVVGVAPDVKVQTVRVLGSGGGYTSDIVAGITWASGGVISGIPANPTPARVISMSLGGGSTCSTAEQTAISGAIGRGTVVVVAAGNSNSNTSGFTPASCTGVIAVAAVSSNGLRASFSNYGSIVDVAAPGVGILSTLNSGSTTPSTPSYASYNGTSMATPHVSGVVALMLSQNPGLTPAQVEAKIKTAGMYTPFPGGACDPDPTKTCGVGIINAGALLNAGAGTVAVTGVTVSPTSFTLNPGQTQQVTATIAPANATNTSVTWTSSNPAVATVSSGGLVTAVAAGTTTVTVTTADGGRTASAVATVSTTTSATGVSVSPTTVTLAPGQTQALTPTVTPSTATNKTVSWASSNTAVASVSATGVITAVAAGSATITVRTADGGFTATTAVTVSTLAQTITFSLPASLRLDQGPLSMTATASSGLTVVLTSTTPSVCTVSNGTRLNFANAGTCSVTATQAGNASYSAADPVTALLTVAKAQQAITFTPPSTLSLTQSPYTLLATSNRSLPVTVTSSTPTVCTVSSTRLTLLKGGTCSLTANQAGTANYEAAAPVTASIRITKRSQAITFTTLGSVQAGSSASFVATSSSGLPVRVTSQTPSACTVASGRVSAVSGGTCTLLGEQDGDDLYDPAAPVYRSFTVTKRGQTITFTPPSSLTLAQSPFTLVASASSGLPVTFTSTTPSVCTVSGTGLVLAAAGTCGVTATQEGDSATNGASISRTLSVGKLTQSVAFTPAGSLTGLQGSYALSATATSGLAVAFAASPASICTVSGTSLLLVSSGNCSVTASQPGNDLYTAAKSVTRVIPIAQTRTTTSLAVTGGTLLTTAPVTLTATVTPAYGDKVAGMTVTFYSRRTTGGSWTRLGSALTNAGGTAQWTTSYDTAAGYTLMSEVQATGLYSSSQGSAQISVTRVATTTSVSASAPSSFTTAPVTFTARVVPASGDPVAGMSVTFASKTSTSGTYSVIGRSVTDASGSASLTTSFANAASYDVQAYVTGTVTHAESGGLAPRVSVTRIATTTSVTPSTTISATGTPVGFAATVTPEAGAAVAGMLVTFYTKAATSSAWAVAGSARTDATGVARFTRTFPTVGLVDVLAEVSGTTTHAQSRGTSARMTITRRS